jgi:hypothetical protein
MPPVVLNAENITVFLGGGLGESYEAAMRGTPSRKSMHTNNLKKYANNAISLTE